MDEVTGRWGIKVSQVEINEIDPPPGVKAAMEREKSAAAIKTAEITESEGSRQAAINRAEGEKQSAILTAEGSRQAEILNAEGDQQAAILRADGFSTALDHINAVAQSADARTMSLQYFDTLRQMGNSPATKFIFPMEFTSMLESFIGSTARRQNDQ
jgi:regulator of protease activity HflC (stomatin/prohibitin superfamily)